MNHVQQRAQRRIKAIKSAGDRIRAKISGLPHDARVPAWKQRLAEYEVSLKALDLELATGKPMNIGGVVVTPPAGSMSLEGK